MRRYAKLLVMLALCSVLCAGIMLTTASASSVIYGGKCGENLSWKLDSDGLLTIEGTGEMISNKLPWRSYKSQIISVSIGDSVTSIGSGAFSGCTALKEIIIPDSVTSIGDDAFNNCSSLNSITMGDGFENIGINAFYGTSYYKDNNNWYDGALYIGNSLVTANYDITSCNIRQGTTSIAPNAFLFCHSLESISIPSGVIEIGNKAFYGCDKLESITIPDTVKSVGKDAFVETAYYNNKNNWEKGFLYIDNCLVKADAYTQNYEIKADTRQIGAETFKNCTGLESVIIPKTVVGIANDTFSGCDNLKYVFFGGDETAWNNVYINSNGNSKLVNAAIHYNTTEHVYNQEKATAAYLKSAATETKNAVYYKSCVCGLRGTATFEGHDIHPYGTPTYKWGTGNTTCTATRMCTCGAYETETANSTNDKTDAKCGVAGIITYEAIFTNTAFTTQTKTENIPALEHTFGNAVFTWADDGKSATAKITCTRKDCGHEESGNASISSDVKTPASCKDMGTTTYTAKVTLNATEYTATKDIADIALLPHAYGEASYEWNDNFTKCTATRVCACGEKETETADSTSEESQPKCGVPGTRTYTVTFTNSAFATQTKTENISALEHKYRTPTYTWSADKSTCTATRVCEHDAAHIEKETANSIKAVTDAKCGVAGLITYTAKFIHTEFTTQTTTIEIQALDHTYGNAVFTWADDGKTASARITCTRKDCGNEISGNATVTGIIKTPSTCTLNGTTTYTAKVTLNGTEYTDTKDVSDIARLPHSYGDASYAWSDDYTKCTATRVCTCGEKETETAESISTITTAAKFSVSGVMTYTATFKNSAFTTQTKAVSIPALEQDMGEPTYIWSKDYSTCIATAVDKNDSTHIETETANSTNTVTTPAKCGVLGVRTYTATFTNSVFTTQTTTSEIPALEHNYGTPTYTWSEDNSTCTAKCECLYNCGDVITEEEFCSVVTTEPQCGMAGSRVYTATFSNSKFTTQTTTEEISALEHSFTKYVYNNDAKIGVDGTETAYCDNGCGETHTRTKEGSALVLTEVFTDVKANAYYAEAVIWAVNNKITSGVGKNQFAPKNNCTRGEVVTFLWRANGCPEPTATENPFTDVKEKDFYYKAVLWAVEKNITSGTGGGKFSPKATCTRSQVATFIWRAEGKPEPTATENPFSDIKPKDYYYKAVLWAVEKGITGGTGNGKFSPDVICTREQIVTFLYRDLGKKPE